MPWNYVQQDDGAKSIDEAIRLTVADMPNALRLLENS